MTPERWQRVNELFLSALEREVSQRRAFLEGACAGDPSLHAAVEALLASDADAESADFLEAPAYEFAAELLTNRPDDSMAGRRIGPYRIVRELGRGGMGAVYLAERADDQVRKQVAIKLVKRGMDTDAILRRFRSEQQILADLDHPNIAKFLDAGSTEDGLSYFIMDYIEGWPLHQYCDAQQLAIERRLDLFRTVCAAVQYAHEQHVIHRDLKPSNILVTTAGVPKLLDFGIAKLLHPEDAVPTTDSVAAGRPMTPEYASPEQVRGEALTPRSDIYALGVVLYELLTGHRPYRLPTRTPEELARVLREEEPEKPSTAVSRVEAVPGADGTEPRAVTPESVSQARASQPGTLCRRLAGDLDNIVLMALRKEPARRYASVEQFSEDIRRHLEGRPVIARRDILGYRSAKFIKRNKTGVIAATLALALLVLIGVDHFQRSGREQATNSATVLPKAIDSIAVLPLANLSGDPEQEYFADGMTEALITDLAKIRALRVISRTSVMMYKGARQPLPEIGRQLHVDAVIEGSVQRVGDRVQIAVQLIEAATDRPLWAERYERDVRDVLLLQNEMARTIAQAIKIKLTPQEQTRLASARSVHSGAYQDYLMGRHYLERRTEAGLKKSLEYFQQAMEKDPNYAPAYAGLADGYLLLASYGFQPLNAVLPQAKAAALKALAMDDTLAEAHAALGFAQHSFDWDWSAAQQAYERAIELNPGYATAHHWYSVCLHQMGRSEEALAEAKRAQELDPLSLNINANVAQQLHWARQHDQAVQQYRKTLEIDPNFYRAHGGLGQAYLQKAMYREAIAELQKAVNLSEGNPLMLAWLGYAYAVSGQKSEAAEILKELKARSRRRHVSPFCVAMIYVGLEENDPAFAWLEKAYKSRSFFICYLKVLPIFDPLRADPRFADLVRRVGLPP